MALVVVQAVPCHCDVSIQEWQIVYPVHRLPVGDCGLDPTTPHTHTPRGGVFFMKGVTWPQPRQSRKPFLKQAFVFFCINP